MTGDENSGFLFTQCASHWGTLCALAGMTLVQMIFFLFSEPTIVKKTVELSFHRPSWFSNVDPRLKLLFVLIMYFFAFQIRTSSTFSPHTLFRALCFHGILAALILFFLYLSNTTVRELGRILKRLRIFIVLIIVFNLIRYARRVHSPHSDTPWETPAIVAALISCAYCAKLMIMMMTSEWLIATTPVKNLLGAFSSKSAARHCANDNNHCGMLDLFVLTISLLPVYLERVEMVFQSLKTNEGEKKKCRLKAALDNLTSMIRNIPTEPPDVLEETLDATPGNSASQIEYSKRRNLIFAIAVLSFTLFWEYLIIAIQKS